VTATLLGNAGALATLALGVLGLCFPARASAFVSLQPVGLLGTSELRATFGGLFAALGLTCLVSQLPAVFATAGIAWIGAAAGRTVSVVLDASRSARNLGGIAFELAIGLPLLASGLVGG